MAKRRKLLNESQLPNAVTGINQFTQLIDTPNDYIGQVGKSVRVNIAENGLEYFSPGGAGSSSFLDLIDTPSSYIGNGLRILRVNSAATAIEYDPNNYTITTRLINTNNGITGGGDLSVDRTLGLTGQALAIHNLTTTGYVVRTGAATFASRVFTGGTGISLTNADGVTGNTTITLNATLAQLTDIVLTTPASGQALLYNGANWINSTIAAGTVTSVATGTGLTGGTITGAGTLSFDIPWGDARYVRLIESLSTSSLWTHTSLQSGIDFTSYTTGSTGYPSTLGFAVAFYASTSDSTSGFGRAFALNREYNTENYYLGSPNTSGTHNGWRLIYHTGNLTITTLGGVAATTVLTVNGISQDLSANRTFNVGTVTSISTGAGLTGGTITASGTLSLTGQALGLHNIVTNGFIYRNGVTVGARIITGSEFIAVTNGDGSSGNPTVSLGAFNLQNISDVTLTTPVSGQVLQYNGTIWVNASVSGGGGGTVSSITAGAGLSGGTITSAGTIAVIYGAIANTSAQGDDIRFHNSVTIGSSNGLSLSTQVLSLALSTISASGAMSSTDKAKLDGLSNYSHPLKTWADKTTLSGAAVISNLTIDSLGHPTGWVTRNITLSDLNYTGASNADNYSSWSLAASGTAGTGTVTSGATVTVTAGSNVSVTRSLNNITISATDTNNTYTAGTGLTLSGGSQFIHNNGALGAAAYGGSGISSITLDSLGHISAIGIATYVTSSASTNYIPRMSSASSLVNSVLYESLQLPIEIARIGMFTASPSFAFHMLRGTADDLELVVQQAHSEFFATNNALADFSGVSIAAFGSAYVGAGQWAGRAGVYINDSRAVQSGQGDVNRSFNVWIGARTIIRSLPAGQTAIGQFDPTAWLDVGGTLRVRTINSAAGDVLTADANGNVTKQTAAQIVAAGGGGGGTPTLQQVTDTGNTTTQNVGLNISPSNRLHVNGGGISLTGGVTVPVGIDGLHLGFDTDQVGKIYSIQNGTAWRTLNLYTAAFQVLTQDVVRLLISDTGVSTFTGEIIGQAGLKTSAPTGSSAQNWKLGAANFTGSGSPTHQVVIQVGGTVYKLLAVV